MGADDLFLCVCWDVERDAKAGLGWPSIWAALYTDGLMSSPSSRYSSTLSPDGGIYFLSLFRIYLAIYLSIYLQSLSLSVSVVMCERSPWDSLGVSPSIEPSRGSACIIQPSYHTVVFTPQYRYANFYLSMAISMCWQVLSIYLYIWICVEDAER